MAKGQNTVYLHEIWPTSQEIQGVIDSNVRQGLCGLRR
jgi:hypothetical protein